VHLLVTRRGEPVEFVLAPGSDADIEVFKRFALDLSAGSTIHADKGYTDYQEEDLLQEAGGIKLLSQRKRNAKRQRPLWEEFVSSPLRKRVETTFSRLTNWFPRHIHAVTRRGFMLKLVCFLVAFSMDCLCR
jgi:transposase